ncbi:hypothetical protein K449DRAFT_382607 [Hypoxylon sp. EC38]|nr:hypothetical protein K449DRAFT_382607 [Hypoxylon sp. EC38]
MRFLALPTSLFLSITLHTHISTALDNDFSAYPQGSQQCLNDAADQSKCSGNTGQELNQCLCRNQGNFIYNTASCVAKSSPGDLNAVYDTMQNNCAGTGVTIAVSKDAFLSQAAAATSTTSGSPTSTPTSTSISTPTDSSTSTTSTPSTTASAEAASSGISTSAKIGLGVGTSFGAIALGLLGWFVWAYSRRRRRSQSHAPNSPDHDVELSPSPHNPNNNHNHNHHNNSSYVSTLTPATSYAQFGGVAELAPASNQEWKELPAGYYDSDGAKSDKRGSGVPLLRAEMGFDEARTTGSSPSPSPATTQIHGPGHEHGYGYGHGNGLAAELPGDGVYNNSNNNNNTTPTHMRTPVSPYSDPSYGHGYGQGG